MNELTATNRTISLTPAKPAVEVAVQRRAAGTKAAASESGKPMPPVGKSKPVDKPPIETKAAVEQLNRFLKDTNRSLQFEIDEERGRTIIRVVNPQTQEVIREIPPDAVRVMAASVRAGRLALIDKLV